MRTLKHHFYSALFVLMAVVATVSAGESRDDSVRYLGVELSHVSLTSEAGSGKVVYATPGEFICGQADCVLYRPQYMKESIQVIVGLEGIGAQDGIRDGNFTLVAPLQSGVYEVRFRYAQAYGLKEAVEHWWGVDCTPPYQATIGLVIVSEDIESDPCEINDGNFKEWLSQKYAGNEHVDDAIEKTNQLTADMVSQDGFWDVSKTTGDWIIDGSSLSNAGTLRYNEFNQIVSKQAFQQFNLRVTEVYQCTRNKETAWWSHSRGFSVLYYVNDKINVEFRYFADIGQLSLYVRDGTKVIELMRPARFSQGSPIVQDITIVDGVISWRVNDTLIFEEVTTLKYGRLMLTNHNNAVTFRF